MGHATDPCRGLVRGDDRGSQQLGLDRRTGRVEGRTHAAERVGDGALGDGQSEQLLQHPRQALEADMMAVVQVGQQGADAGPERGARRHAGRRIGPVAPPAPPAAAAKQLDPGHHPADLRHLDVVVAMPAPLCRR